MQYRTLGNTGQELSILGFGAMRLPIIDNKDAHIDEQKAHEMLKHAVDKGVNYLDTAWPYHGGSSELFCGRFLAGGYRDRVKIATKLPCWEITCHEDMDSYLNRQLERLQTDSIDFYLLHALCGSFWETMKKHRFADFLDRARSSGKIGYAGFSYHDNAGLFKEIVDAYDWDFCQIQLNYLDDNYQAGLEGMRYAAEKGLGVIIMEPLRGGMLARTELPADLQNLWDSAVHKRSPAEWALRYVWDFPENTVVLSGMSSLNQVKENLRIAGEALPLSLDDSERGLIAEAREFYKGRIRVDCTNCRYCMPCPVGVDIPENFWAYNHDAIFDDRDKAEYWLNNWLKKEARASACVECGACEEHCPQNIDIREHLKIIAGLYEN